MSTKMNTKKLSILFAVLLILSAVVMIRNNSKSSASRNRTFKSELCDFDSAKVTDITITPRGQSPVQLHKKGSEWLVTIDDKEHAADEKTIDNMLALLMYLRATRVAATDKSKWEKYEVTDSLALRVELKAGKKTVADLMMGKFSYQQPKNTEQNPYAQRQMGKMTSYVRLNGEKEVYATDGLLSLSFNRQANEFRNHSILTTQKHQLESIEVTTPQENYLLKKQGLNWMVDGLIADSLQIDSYLDELENVRNSNFIDQEELNRQEVSYKLTLNGKALSSPIELQVFAADTASAIGIISSQNTGNYFDIKDSDILEKLFKNKMYFSKHEE